MGVDLTTDHAARAVARLAEELKGKTILTALLNNLNAQTQDLENALYALLTERFVDTAIGAQLDVIGRIVNQPRNTTDDDVYRVYLKARIKANISNGTVEDIYGVFVLLFPEADLEIRRNADAAFEFFVSNLPLDPDLIDIYTSFLLAAKSAGVYAVFRWLEGDEDDAFSFYDCPDGEGLGDSTDASAGGEFAGADGV